MKKIVLLLLFNATLAFAAQSKITKLQLCLAQEEERIHLNRIKGPVETLNKELVTLMASVTDLHLKAPYYEKVCTTQVYSPSIALLEVVIKHGKSAFYSTTKDEVYRGFQNNFLEDLENNSGRIFLSYLSHLQGLTTYSKCLEVTIPELKKIYSQYKYLEMDMDPKKFISEEEFDSIFKKLFKFDEIIKKCDGYREKELEELKKPFLIEQ